MQEAPGDAVFSCAAAEIRHDGWGEVGYRDT